MKILHTVHRYPPYTGGSEEVVRQLSERLVSFGHQVTVATTPSLDRTSKIINGVVIEEFDCSGDLVQGIKGDSERYKNFITGSDFDIVMNYGAQIWCTDLFFEFLSNSNRKSVFVPLGFYRLTDPEYSKYFEAMPNILRQYSAVVYLSSLSPDKEFADEHHIKNGVVIPNGTQISDFPESERGKFRKKYHLGNDIVVLNVSNHSDVKNHPLFWKCVRESRIAGMKFVLIGNSLKSNLKKWVRECYSMCRLNGVRFQSLVLENTPRKEVTNAFVDADVFLFTSKFECSPLVMFESFASKTLFVTTDCGNVKDFSDCVCIFKDASEARAILNDYKKNPEKYFERINKGFEYVQKKLNWDTITRQYEELYLNLLKAEKKEN